MKKKLVKYGNSTALVIDKPILQLLSIDETAELEISTDGESLILTPVKTKKIKKESLDNKLNRIVEKNIKRYAPALKKLAKN
jgi:antitoxin component of MazEF toxin-antitoxin module